MSIDLRPRHRPHPILEAHAGEFRAGDVGSTGTVLADFDHLDKDGGDNSSGIVNGDAEMVAPGQQALTAFVEKYDNQDHVFMERRSPLWHVGRGRRDGQIRNDKEA